MVEQGFPYIRGLNPKEHPKFVDLIMRHEEISRDYNALNKELLELSLGRMSRLRLIIHDLESLDNRMVSWSNDVRRFLMDPPHEFRQLPGYQLFITNLRDLIDTLEDGRTTIIRNFEKHVTTYHNRRNYWLAMSGLFLAIAGLLAALIGLALSM